MPLSSFSPTPRCTWTEYAAFLQQYVRERKNFSFQHWSDKRTRSLLAGASTSCDLPVRFGWGNDGERERSGVPLPLGCCVVTMQIVAIAEINKGGLAESITTSAQSVTNPAMTARVCLASQPALPSLDRCQKSRRKEMSYCLFSIWD